MKEREFETAERKKKINKEHLSQNIYESINMAGNETDAKERGGKNGGERAARLEPGCGGDGDDGESSKGLGGLLMSASIISGSLIALHHCYSALMSALLQRSTFTLIVVELRWRLFKAMTWWDGGSCTHTEICTLTCTPNNCTLYSITST